MPSFDSAGVPIRYESYESYQSAGAGAPIVLVHGFGSDLEQTWRETGWIEALTRAGRRAVALDCRGHGRSGKPREPAAYADVPGDVIRLMDHLAIDRAALLGYSMGGRIALQLMAFHAHRFDRAVLGGIGATALATHPDPVEEIARVLEAEGRTEGASEVARGVRAFAEASRNDLRALAACMRGLPRQIAPDALARVRLPALIVVGEQDRGIGDPRAIRSCLAGSKLEVIAGADHLGCVAAPRFREVALDFLRA